MMPGLFEIFVPEQIVTNRLSLFDLGAEVPKQTLKKWAVANDNSFWTIGFLVSIWERKFQNKQWNLTSAFRFGSESSKTNSEI